MHRRTFLTSLAALTAGMALDPERALWVPGRRTYFDLGATAPEPWMFVGYLTDYSLAKSAGSIVTLDGVRFTRQPPFDRIEVWMTPAPPEEQAFRFSNAIVTGMMTYVRTPR